MLVINNVKKQIENQTVLENLSFTVQRGSITGLLGKNGAGKTTLLRILMGVLDPDEGSVCVDGINLHENPAYKQNVVFVSDSTTILATYTVSEIVAFYKTVYTRFDEAYFYEMLKKFELPNGKIRSYSRGMKAAVAILLAFSTRAPYIILDEPTNGLDPIMRKRILRYMIEEVAERELTILVATHQLQELESIADCIVLLQEGKVRQYTLESVRDQYRMIQIAFEKDIPFALQHMPNIKIMSQVGRVYRIVLEGDIEETIQQFNLANPIFLEELPMSLEDLFVYILGGDHHVA